MAATNEKVKATHSRRDLKARVKCAKAIMKAKYEYHMAVQGARAERCTELEELEATYSEAPKQKCGHFVSPVCYALLGTHRTHVGIGSTCLEDGEARATTIS